MSRRKEKIRDGLEIDFDLLDSDTLRWHRPLGVSWSDGPRPLLVWSEFADDEGWTEGMDAQNQMMMRTLDDERELAEGRRLLRLHRYKSYGCLAELAERPLEPGEFVIRKPPTFGISTFVCDLDEANLSPGFGDPDSPTFADESAGFSETTDVAEAQRFTHADAIRLTIQIMEELGYDIPGDNGDYYEPVRLDVAEELYRRAERRPRTRDALGTMLNDLSREPEE